jgi:hypothetical protein
MLDDVAAMIMSRLRTELRAIISEAIAQAKDKYRVKYLAACLADATASRSQAAKHVSTFDDLEAPSATTSSPLSTTTATTAAIAPTSLSSIPKRVDTAAIRKKALQMMLGVLFERCYIMMQRHKFLAQVFSRASSVCGTSYSAMQHCICSDACARVWCRNRYEPVCAEVQVV